MSTVFWIPEDIGPMVTMHACWGADNGYETAVFPTEAEAVAFAWKRWRSVPKVTRRPPAAADLPVPALPEETPQ